ncbi:MAG: AAA family ATPase [Lewinellaceae bacterium]|nr:AAA family ATPase [Lewinellaceae bacterium]
MSGRKKTEGRFGLQKYSSSGQGYFVDKTLLIKEFHENGDKVLLIPRPRRFGKTLNLSMIEHFFDINKKRAPACLQNLRSARKKVFASLTRINTRSLIFL